jgi:hypothetical protein
VRVVKFRDEEEKQLPTMENTLKLKADNDRMGTLVENLLKQGK